VSRSGYDRFLSSLFRFIRRLSIWRSVASHKYNPLKIIYRSLDKAFNGPHVTRVFYRFTSYLLKINEFRARTYTTITFALYGFQTFLIRRCDDFHTSMSDEKVYTCSKCIYSLQWKRPSEQMKHSCVPGVCSWCLDCVESNRTVIWKKIKRLWFNRGTNPAFASRNWGSPPEQPMSRPKFQPKAPEYRATVMPARWRIDPLLNNDSVNNDRFWATAR
jgi:hypothetical protein